MKPAWSRSVAILSLTALLAACSGPKVSVSPADGSPAPASQPPASPTAAAPSPSPSPVPTKAPSPTPPSPSPSPTVKPTETPKATAKPSEAPAATDKPAATKAPAATAKPASGNAAKAVSWYYMKKKKGEVPGFPAETKSFTAEQKVAWVGTGKKIYLTFDTGGPMGDVDKLLKALKDNGVKANFFLAGYNVKANPEFVKRLVADGHLVANHTMSHKDMTTMTDEQVRKEINDYAALIKDITGKNVQMFFRFPYGSYTPHLLDLVGGMGYTSVFWSLAMRDWEPRANGADDAYNDVINGLHDGAVILMHQGSEDNINALDRILKEVKKEGYTFGQLTDLAK